MVLDPHRGKRGKRFTPWIPHNTTKGRTGTQIIEGSKRAVTIKCCPTCWRRIGWQDKLCDYCGIYHSWVSEIVVPCDLKPNEGERPKMTDVFYSPYSTIRRYREIVYESGHNQEIVIQKWIADYGYKRLLHTCQRRAIIRKRRNHENRRRRTSQFRKK